MADPNEWGLFDNENNPLVVADSVIGVEIETDARISSYPQQEGAFASYNKVQLPTSVKVTYAIADSDDARFELIDALDIARRGLTTYMLGMPEYSYPSVNVTHYGFRRTAKQGVKLLLVEVFCEEVRILGSQNIRFGKSINSSDTKSQGTVQATDSTDVFPTVPADATPPT